MKTVSGRVVSTKPVSISKAARSLSKFVSSTDHGASQAVSAYLRRASTAFNELVQFHKEHKASNFNLKLRKHRHVYIDEIPVKTNRIPQELEENRVGNLESSRRNKKSDRNPINIDQKGIEVNEDREGNVGDSVRKREKKKKKNEGLERKIGGNLGIEQKGVEVEEDREINVEDSVRKKEKRKKKSEGAEREGEGHLRIEVERRKEKKKRKSEEVDNGEIGNSAEQSVSKKKKRRRIDPDD